MADREIPIRPLTAPVFVDASPTNPVTLYVRGSGTVKYYSSPSDDAVEEGTVSSGGMPLTASKWLRGFVDNATVFIDESVAVSAGSSVPDPADGTDGQIPTVEDGAYVLADPTGGVSQHSGLATTLAKPKGRPWLLPDDVKVIGGNITVKGTYPRTHNPPQGGTYNQGVWMELYLEWDWDGWIKPQIDRARALGMNGIRLIGDVFGLILDYYEEDYYFDCWRQLIEYCGEQGMYVYPNAGDQQHWVGQTASVVAPYVARFCAFVQQFDNVFAVDLGNESDQNQTTWNTLATAVRAAAPGLPIGWSSIGLGGVSTGQDFHDGHFFSQVNGAPTMTDGNHALNDSVPTIIGEFGSPVSASTGTRQAQFRAVRDYLAMNPSVAAVFVWALADQAVNPADDTDNYGIFTNAGAERTDVTGILKFFPQKRTSWPIQKKFTGDAALAAGAYSTQKVTLNLSLAAPALLHINAWVDLDVTMAGNQYNVYCRTNSGEHIDADGIGGDFPQAIALGVGRHQIPINYTQMVAPGNVAVDLEAIHATGTDAAATIKAGSRMTVTVEPL